nr:NTPase [Candidatus Sigynarchaeota archaeon]
MANILLTGVPGVGKTTVIKHFIERANVTFTGFYTGEERNAGGQRIGFKVTRVDGSKEATFASINLSTKARIGKYAVDVDRFESVALPMLDPGRADLVVIDEIGKMEMFSAQFKQKVLACLDTGRVLATILMKSGVPFTDGIKQRHDVTLLEVTRENRERLVDRLLSMVQGSR